MNPVMTLRGVSASYEGKSALQDLSLDIPEKQITAVVGPSGCGKSTLLRCMNGLLHEEPGAAVSGSACLDGADISLLPKDALRRRVGLVFQTPTPFPFSIYKNMTYAAQYHGLRDKAALETLVREKLQLAGLYDEVKDELNKNALKLSGGQQQRLCIARALTVEPEILLLDEPCSALDVKSTQTIEETLLKLKERYTVVIVTHNLAQARRIADRTVFLMGGRLVEEGPTEQLFTQPQQEETRRFLSGAIG
ncbi:MAG: phosphate ABC transporter ATP-binding protein [Oscillospiraceae bacterium]